MWRPKGWANPYKSPKGVVNTISSFEYNIYEAGADAILRALRRASMWRNLETVRQSRWWFFWNFVVRGKSLSFQTWTTGEDKVKLRIGATDSATDSATILMGGTDEQETKWRVSRLFI